MRLYPIKTPALVRTLYPDCIWSFPSDQKQRIYLTFDDGPTPHITEFVLDQLKKFKAKATFFCVGNNVEKHPELFDLLIKEGHAVGNHSFSHLKGWKTSRKNYLEDVLRAQNILESRKGYAKDDLIDTKLFRPPYGKMRKMQSRDLQKTGFHIVMWDVLSADWEANITQEQCYANVTNKAQNGSIVVFHDSEKAFKNLRYALPKALDYFSKKGFEFKSIVAQDL